MARKPDIQYIHYQIDGSAARQLEPKFLPQRKVLPGPKTRQEKPKLVLSIDPLLTAGVLVAAVMLVLIFVGFSQLETGQNQVDQMQTYVQKLSADNIQLSEQYETSCDLEDVEYKALALGMIPAEQAQHISIVLPKPEPVAEPSFWEQISARWHELFA